MSKVMHPIMHFMDAKQQNNNPITSMTKKIDTGNYGLTHPSQDLLI
jgi:hypothetical protein